MTLHENNTQDVCDQVAPIPNTRLHTQPSCELNVFHELPRDFHVRLGPGLAERGQLPSVDVNLRVSKSSKTDPVERPWIQ